MTDLLRVAFIEDKARIIRRLREKGTLDYFQKMATESAEPIAMYASKRFKDLLSKSHKFRVGASGKASENFVVSLGQSSFGRKEWIVGTGNLTKSNEYIRWGIEPFKSAPPIEKLKQWVRDKGITLQSYYTPVEEKVSGYTRKSSTGKSVTVKGYIRQVAGEAKKQADDPYYRIRTSIYLYGTNRKPDSAKGVLGSHWRNLYPVGQGKFDYPAYLMKQQSNFSVQVAKMGLETSSAIVNYVMTGRKKKGTRTF